MHLCQCHVHISQRFETKCHTDQRSRKTTSSQRVRPLDGTSTTILLSLEGIFLRTKPIPVTDYSHLYGKLRLEGAHTSQERTDEPAKLGLGRHSPSSCPFRPVPVSVKHHPISRWLRGSGILRGQAGCGVASHQESDSTGCPPRARWRVQDRQVKAGLTRYTRVAEPRDLLSKRQTIKGYVLNKANKLRERQG